MAIKVYGTLGKKHKHSQHRENLSSSGQRIETTTGSLLHFHRTCEEPLFHSPMQLGVNSLAGLYGKSDKSGKKMLGCPGISLKKSGKQCTSCLLSWYKEMHKEGD
jgi:hypothetical protein